MPAYKDDKRGTWYAKFRYTNWTGKKIETMKRGFATKREAKAYEESARKERTAAEGMTFGELYDIYIEDMKNRLREITIKNKRAISERHILPYFSGKKISTISPADIRKWHGEILGLSLAPTSTRNIHAQISSILNYAVKYYGLMRNPAKAAESIGKESPKDMDFWTTEEYKKYMAYEWSRKYRAAVSILFWGGLRIGELLALTWGDIVGNEARITKTMSKISNGRNVVTPPKTPKSKRNVFLPSEVLLCIDEHKKSMYHPCDDDRIFHVGSESIRIHFNTVCERAGVKKIRLHDLRHSHASYLINRNVPIKFISARLGHDKIETTLRTYAHLYKDTENAVFSLIESDAKKCGQNVVK